MTKTLLVDGNNLFKISFHGAKDLFHDGKHIGGIYHFLYILKKFLEIHNHDKVIVFWDGDSNTSIRKQIYPYYKSSRNSVISEYQQDSFTYQKNRIKQYLEEIFVRQVEVENNEADDLISYYCKISVNENIIIFSGDKDLTQLITEKVSVYSPVDKKYYRYNDKIPIKKINIHHKNITLCKILVGDSDDIAGIKGLGEKTLVDILPEIQVKPVTLDDFFNKVKILSENKTSKVINNVLTGTSKYGIFGEEFYKTNDKLINLSNPLLTDDGVKVVEMIHSEMLDPTDRGYKNLMKMMMEDGLFKYLPKTDNAWVDFLRPFMKLIRKEKNKK